MSGIAVANVLLRHRRMILFVAGVFFAVALAYTLSASRTYTSRASFAPVAQRAASNVAGLAAQLGLQTGGGDPAQSPSFYSELIPSREVLGALSDSSITVREGGSHRKVSVATWLGVGTKDSALSREQVFEKLRRSINVKTSAASGIVRIAVTTRDPDVSRQFAARTIEAINAFNSRRRRERTENDKEFIESQLAEASGRLHDAERRLLAFQIENRQYRTSPTLSFEAERLGRDVGAKQEVYTSVQRSYEQARVDAIRDAPSITVFESPNYPVVPDARGTVTKAASGLLLGILLGALLAFLVEYFMRSRSVYPSAVEEFQLLKQQALADLRLRRR
jgi:uncharacterized protein involved in exopolysaccharide biosynthesis